MEQMVRMAVLFYTPFIKEVYTGDGVDCTLHQIGGYIRHD